MRKTLIAALLISAVVTAAAFAAGSTQTGPSSSLAPYVFRRRTAFVDLAAHRRRLDRRLSDGRDPGRVGRVREQARHVHGPDEPRDRGGAGGGPRPWCERRLRLALVVENKSLEVASGRDQIVRVATWNTTTSAYNPPAKGVAIGRLCSATLAAREAFYDKHSGTGYKPPLFLSGEEVGNEGRSFAHAEDGISWELASLGKFSWENAAANPATGRKTVVFGTDDTSPTGQVYIYVGEKKATGNPAERAGLTGGKLYGIKVPGSAIEPVNTGLPSGTAFTAADLGDVTNLTGAQIETASDAAQVTEWQRPEDASWDPKHPNDLYFVITSSFTTQSKLYRLRFADPADPAAGGKVDQLLDGTETGGTAERLHMLDNLTVDTRGNVMLQEDPGNQPYLARIWQYDIKRDALTEVATFDPALFTPGAANFVTQDEESSGIIDASDILGHGWYLLDAQVHKTNPDPELVEYGQLLALFVPGGGLVAGGGTGDDD